MSTRSNLQVTFGATTIYLYRHMDGYPAINGMDICEAVSQSRNPSELIVNLLARKYDKKSYEKEAQPIYTVTSEWHGDIEWAYVVEYDRDYRSTTPRIGVCEIGFGLDRGTVLASLDSMRPTLDMLGFLAMCKEALARMEAQEAAYKAEQALATKRSTTLMNNDKGPVSKQIFPSAKPATPAKPAMSDHLQALIANINTQKVPATKPAPTTTKPAATKPTATKPTATKPTTTKPATTTLAEAWDRPQIEW